MQWETEKYIDGFNATRALLRRSAAGPAISLRYARLAEGSKITISKRYTHSRVRCRFTTVKTWKELKCPLMDG